MFCRNKNTTKNLAYGLQEKYLKSKHYSGINSCKYLGREAIKIFKYIAPQTARGSKQLFRAEGKRNIQMRSAAQMSEEGLGPVLRRSAEQMKGKEISSLINMVTESKPQLPFLFVAGGLNRLTQFNLAKKKGEERTLADRACYKHLLAKNQKIAKSQEMSKSAKVLKAEEVELLKNFQAYKHTERTLDEKNIYYGTEPSKELYDADNYESMAGYKADGGRPFFQPWKEINPKIDFSAITVETNKEQTPSIKICYCGSDQARKDAWYSKNLILNSYPMSIFEFQEEGSSETNEFTFTINKKLVFNKKKEGGISFRDDLNGLIQKIKDVVEA